MALDTLEKNLAKSHSVEDKEDRSAAYHHDDFHFDPAQIARLRRKIDWRLLPLLSLMYLCSFLDRVNIGNAKVAGLERDIGLTPDQYSWALSIFFIGYIIAETPSQMLALFPGAVFVISLFYSRGEQALRNGLFFSTATMAGAFGGVLAYGWQWIFILEGLPTVLLTIVVFFYLPDYPETATFLSEDERDLAVRRLLADAGPATETEFSWKQFRDVFVDLKVYLHMVPYILTMTPLYALALFLPALVREFSFEHEIDQETPPPPCSAVTSQLMTTPAYIVGCICTILAAISSDRYRERGFHYAIPILMGALGFALLIALEDHSTAVRYIGLTVAVSGVFSSVPAMVAYISSNFGGHTKRAVATGLIISFGNCGGLISGHIYAPGQTTRGHLICLIMLCVAFLFILLLKTFYVRENRRRRNLTPEQFEKESQGVELCDWHPGKVQNAVDTTVAFPKKVFDMRV
ncbi:hypothetical protein EC968_000813 [Mortierella alpina]|nr:hypothetical protein EC968_000813 [Mortierella alpina]